MPVVAPPEIPPPEGPLPGMTPPKVPPPGEIKFLSVEQNSVTLSWECPKGLKKRSKSFRIEWSSSTDMEDHVVIKDVCHATITKLKPGQKYCFSVATEDEDGSLSEKVTASVFTGKTEHAMTCFFFHCSVFIFYILHC